MVYDSDSFEQYGYVHPTSFDDANAGEDTVLLDWLDPDLIGPTTENYSEAHILPCPQWDSLPSFDNPSPSFYNSFNWGEALAAAYCTQQYGYQPNEHIPCSLDFDDTTTAPLAAPTPFQVPEYLPLSLITWDHNYPQNTYGQHSNLGQMFASNTVNEYGEESYMRTYDFASVPNQANDSIEPHQMHFANLTPPSEIELEPKESSNFPSQTASSPYTLVEQPPPQASRRPSRQKGVSKYEGQIIVFKTIAGDKEQAYNMPVLSRLTAQVALKMSGQL
ncbi:hypothetical protein RSOL_412860, partial [Rhizoctonia solani AG-3 Rhs1AP]